MRNIYDDTPRAVLLAVANEEDDMTNIARKVGRWQTNVFYSIQMLESLGLAETEKKGRVRMVRITEKGRKIASLFREIDKAMG